MQGSNDFEKMCKILDKNDRAKGDMEYVKLYLVNKIKGNKDQLLKLKAECKNGDYMGFSSIMLSTGAILFTMLTALLNYISIISPVDNEIIINKIDEIQSEVITKSGGNMNIIIYMIIFLGSLGVLLYVFTKLRKNFYIYRWGQFISVYLEDMEANWVDYFPDK